MRISKHFTYQELACRHCGIAAVDPVLVCCLEDLRKRIGQPLPVISGYRCPQHNRAVGGAPRSFHVLGQAADIPRGLVRPAVATAAGFRGLGTRDGWVTHVDVRPHPARWVYS